MVLMHPKNLTPFRIIVMDPPIQKRFPAKDENPNVEIIIKNKKSRLLSARTEKQSEAKIRSPISA